MRNPGFCSTSSAQVYLSSSWGFVKQEHNKWKIELAMRLIHEVRLEEFPEEMTDLHKDIEAWEKRAASTLVDKA